MKKYTHIIFDADHTLLNYLADEKQAFLSLYKQLGIPITDELLAVSREASETAWVEAGLYNVTDPMVQKQYHTLYRTHTEDIFRRIFAKFPCESISKKEAGLTFLDKLTVKGVAFDGALDVIRQLSKRCGGVYKVAIATNGLAEIQHKRLEAFAPMVEKVYVSQDLASVKPLPAFFEKMLKDLGAKAKNCLMVGDSLVSDIQGAKAVGMDTCWLNANGLEDKDGVADYTVKNIRAVLDIL